MKNKSKFYKSQAAAKNHNKLVRIYKEKNIKDPEALRLLNEAYDTIKELRRWEINNLACEQ